ncbi:hypothetical protein EDC01DRAFT_777320 [Geopyxis carbonaria]|nr:hypothetical protein EDC01DRAFT_777320 [Geopyxis carbonaria]
MADIDDSAKAEKLAAAKKRFEELKKKGSKKASKKPGKAAASSSKVEKSVEESVTEEPTKAESPIPEEKLEDTPEEDQELEDELAEQRRKAGQMEAENEDLKLKLERALLENRKLTGANPEDDREVDELEDAERQRLREKVHSLEKALDSERRHGRHQRTESMRSAGGFLDDDDVDFGELMKREMEVARAREEENRQKIIDAEAHKQRMEQERIERIREVKRGLEKWRGWRMDLTLVGGSAVGLGEMFEV